MAIGQFNTGDNMIRKIALMAVLLVGLVGMGATGLVAAEEVDTVSVDNETVDVEVDWNDSAASDDSIDLTALDDSDAELDSQSVDADPGNTTTVTLDPGDYSGDLTVNATGSTDMVESYDVLTGSEAGGSIDLGSTHGGVPTWGWLIGLAIGGWFILSRDA